jgi:hypothetical protein
MTQTSHLSSGAITNLDTIPPLANTTGEGAPGYLRSVSGVCTPVAADAALSTYKFVRLPSNAKVKQVLLANEAQGAGKIQLGLYYSDATNDGTAVANQGAVISNCVDFFASDIDLTSAIAQTDETFQNETGANAYKLAKQNQPLWKAAGLATDPGGFIDVVGTVHTTAITTGGGVVLVTVNFVE